MGRCMNEQEPEEFPKWLEELSMMETLTLSLIRAIFQCQYKKAFKVKLDPDRPVLLVSSPYDGRSVVVEISVKERGGKPKEES